MAKVVFEELIDFTTVETPLIGYLIGYDIADGILKQKDKFGVVTPIGAGAVTITPSPLDVVLSEGNNTGLYDIIMDSSTKITSSNGSGKLELDKLIDVVSLSTSNSEVELGVNSVNISNSDSVLTIGDDSSLQISDTNKYSKLDQNIDSLNVSFNNDSLTGIKTVTTIDTGVNYVAGSNNITYLHLNTQGSATNDNIKNSVIIGGIGLVSSSNDTVYVKNLEAQGGLSKYSIEPSGISGFDDLTMITKGYLDLSIGSVGNSLYERGIGNCSVQPINSSNFSNDENSVILNGVCNHNYGVNSTISNGVKNTIYDGDNSFIGSGQVNGINSPSTSISGGQNNTININSQRSSIGGGASNEINSAVSSISGGVSNTINTNSQYSTISSGQNNTINSQYSTISGGQNNTTISGGYYISIINGQSNVNEGNSSIIGAGNNNSILNNNNTVNSSILSGQNNTVDSPNSSIGGGINNTISGYNSNISGGQLNKILGGNSGIGSGQSNLISSNSVFSFIGAGQNNTITDNSVFSFIGAGQSNTSDAFFGGVISGQLNSVSGQTTLIGAGKFNTIESNTTSTTSFSSIVGGLSNNIKAGSNF